MHKNALILCFLFAAFGSETMGAQGMPPRSVEQMVAQDRPDARATRRVEMPFPAHKIVGNIYYVGENQHAAFLLTTPEGHILINSNRERNFPWLQDSIEALGFRLADIKILLGSHAHVDHQEADAILKELTDAEVVAMDRDVPALEAMRPGDKPHPIDRVISDRDSVTLGGMTLTAYLTPGHTKGCTSWVTEAEEEGRSYDVVIMGCIGAAGNVVLANNADYPEIAEDFQYTYDTLRTLDADVFMGSHTNHYNMAEKFEAIGKGPNPFVDPEGYHHAIDNYEKLFHYKLEEQRRAAGDAGNP